MTVRYPLLVLALLMLSGCDFLGGSEADSPAQKEYFRAVLNGEPWEGDPLAGVSDRHAFGIGASYEGAGYYRNSMYFSGDSTTRRLSNFEGTYPLAFSRLLALPYGYTEGAHFTETDGDVVLAEYYATQSESNRLTVTRHDQEAGFIEGTFAVTLAVDPGFRGRYYRRLPDTLRFTDGRFRIAFRDHRTR